ncbi:PPP4R2-domain-containing protein [Crucibulum laeve]|uniref:PPP4R2-domain-containing protein n=1 Tax=Crucibulum laeve TaxID=68775 RepID=A0A5C3MDH6_9AGAR|nr:PPP4R2-domain-containing protein [Crucibulum laeve]
MATDITPDFEWLPEYDTLLENIASTDVVDSEWTKIRDIIKYKIEKNISLFLTTTQRATTPPPFPQIVTPSGGLKLPPFPPRKLSQMHLGEVPISYMDEEQANEMKGYIFTQLDEFGSKPPFTIQRLCELCIKPKENYNTVGKYLRAVEKTILVTSSWDSFPPLSASELDSAGRSTLVLGPAQQSAPSTPLFSPIPFLHDDARRSKSRSPPPTPLSLASVGPANDGHPDAMETKALGLVDELDDPSPGHMSDHPTPLSSVTSLSSETSTPESRPLFASLEQRFVKSEGSAEADSDNMVLDDEKENSKS